MRAEIAFASLPLLAPSIRAQQFVRLPEAFPGPTYWTEGVALSDVDRDGDLDVFFARGEGWNDPGAKHANALFVNRLERGGELRFVDESAARLGVHESHAREVVVGDVQGDGWEDALFANGFGSDVPFLYVNRGAHGPGVFALESAERGLTEVLSSASGAFGDLDDDGDLDLVLSDAGPSWAGLPGGKPRLYLNDGAGNFRDASEQLAATAKTTPMGVHLADLDGDWDLDFFGPNKTGEHGLGHYLLLNQGDARFSDASSLLPPTTGQVYEADVADLDGDLDLDLFFISLTETPAPEGTRFPLGEGPVESLFSGSGKLGFALGTALGIDDDNEVGFLDHDMDGDLDAFIASLGPAEKVHVNAGGMRFAITPGIVEPVADPSLDLALGDLDRDGDCDLVTAQALERIGAQQPPCAVYLNQGPRDARAPRLVRAEEPRAVEGKWVFRVEVRDELVDDGRDEVVATLDYAVLAEQESALVELGGAGDEPVVLRVSPGALVSFRNAGGEALALEFDEPLESGEGGLAPGDALVRSFVTPGVYSWRAGEAKGQVVVAGTVARARATRSGAGIWRFELADGGDEHGALVVYQLRLRDAAGNERLLEPRSFVP